MTGRSLHIGVNEVDATHYGDVPSLRRCEADAAVLAELAGRRFFSPTALLGREATAGSVLGALTGLAGALTTEDTLLVTFSGHGSRVPDLGGDEGADGRDDTWCLFDRQLLDDELAACWASFAAGVRIVVVSDSCHSGTMHRGRRDPRVERWRGLRPRERDAILDRHAAEYRSLAGAARSRGPRRSSLLLLAACTEDERAAEGRDHGLLTGALLRAVDGCRTYPELLQRVRAQLDGVQTPQLRTAGWPDAALATPPLTPSP
jgi:hypothetical protein